MKTTGVLLLSVLVVNTIGCNDNEPARQNVSAQNSFQVSFPRGENWQIVRDGPVGNVEDSYAIAVADAQRGCQLSVVVLPAVEGATSVAAAKAEWEQGLLQKLTRKKASENIQLSGHDAYKIVAELDAPDGMTYEVISILLIAEGRNFNIGVTCPGENVLEDRELKAFVDSFTVAAAK